MPVSAELDFAGRDMLKYSGVKDIMLVSLKRGIIMNFYRRRPLALIITSALLISALCAMLPGAVKIATVALALVLALISLSLFKRRGIKHICNLDAPAFVSILASLTIVLLLTSFAYYDVYVAKYEELESGHVNATVVSVETRTPFGATYGVMLNSRDGKSERARGFISSDSATTFNVGDVIEADVKFCKLDEFYTYRTATLVELLSKGVAFAANTENEPMYCGQGGGISVFLSNLRESFSAKLTLYSDRDSASLADALFLGKRENLGKTERDFKYLGAMHILALSGLHLSIIVGSLERFLMRLVVGSRARYVVCMAIAAFYVGLTGFIASAIRAAVMLAISYSASLFDRSGDRITALFAAIGFIVLAQPTAMFDAGLQLSFAATLGLLLVAQPASCLPEKIGGAPKRKMIFSKFLKLPGEIAVSLGALMFVMPLQWLYFGEVSTMSVAATIVLSPICELLLLLMPPLLAFALLGLHLPGSIISGAVCALCELCTDIAAVLSEYATLYSLGYPFALPIMLICAAIIIIMLVRGCPNWLWALVPFAVSTLVFVGGVHIYDAAFSERATVDTVSISESDIVTLVSNRSAAVILVGDGSSEIVYSAVDRLSDYHLTEVDTLILATPTRRTISSFLKLLSSRRVGAVLIPTPTSEEECQIAADIAALASEYGTSTVLYDNSDTLYITHGGVTVALSERIFIPRSTRALLAVKLTFDGVSVAYISASAWESDEIRGFTKGVQHIVIGAYGPIPKSSPYDTFSGAISQDKAFSFSLNP